MLCFFFATEFSIFSVEKQRKAENVFSPENPPHLSLSNGKGFNLISVQLSESFSELFPRRKVVAEVKIFGRRDRRGGVVCVW
jgi:hypothetical protein